MQNKPLFLENSRYTLFSPFKKGNYNNHFRLLVLTLFSRYRKNHLNSTCMSISVRIWPFDMQCCENWAFQGIWQFAFYMYLFRGKIPQITKFSYLEKCSNYAKNNNNNKHAISRKLAVHVVSPFWKKGTITLSFRAIRDIEHSSE